MSENKLGKPSVLKHDSLIYIKILSMGTFYLRDEKAQRNVPISCPINARYFTFGQVLEFISQDVKLIFLVDYDAFCLIHTLYENKEKFDIESFKVVYSLFNSYITHEQRKKISQYTETPVADSIMNKIQNFINAYNESYILDVDKENYMSSDKTLENIVTNAKSKVEELYKKLDNKYVKVDRGIKISDRLEKNRNVHPYRIEENFDFKNKKLSEKVNEVYNKAGIVTKSALSQDLSIYYQNIKLDIFEEDIRELNKEIGLSNEVKIKENPAQNEKVNDGVIIR